MSYEISRFHALLAAMPRSLDDWKDAAPGTQVVLGTADAGMIIDPETRDVELVAESDSSNDAPQEQPNNPDL